MRILRFGFAILLMAVISAAQESPSISSFRQARQVLDAALQAHGGAAIKDLQSISAKFDGELIHRNQSHRPEAPYERTPITGTLGVDLKSNETYFDQTGSWVGGFNWATRTVRTKDGGVSYDMRNRVANAFPPNNPQVAPNFTRNILRRGPIGFLREANDRAGSLRYVGKSAVEGKPAEVISFASDQSPLLNLYIDSSSHLLTKVEWLESEFVVGDAPNETLFSDYTAVNGIQLPRMRRTKRGGEVDSEQRFAWTVNQPIDTAMLRAPEGFPGPAAPTPPGDAITKLGENVYTMRTSAGYNVLLVGMKDYVFVMEAPGGDNVSREIIAKAKDIFAGKPVKLVAVSHFHDDHAGGARGFMAEGANLITTAGNRAFFDRVRKRNSSIAQDKPVPADVKIEAVVGKRTITDGVTTVELIDIGKGPHTDEMLIAYLPAQKLVFQGDLLNLLADKKARAANLTTLHFAQRLKDLGLDVETIAAVHGPVAKMDDLTQSVALAEQEKGSKSGGN